MMEHGIYIFIFIFIYVYNVQYSPFRHIGYCSIFGVVFILDAVSDTTLPIYLGLGLATSSEDGIQPTSDVVLNILAAIVPKRLSISLVILYSRAMFDKSLANEGRVID